MFSKIKKNMKNDQKTLKACFYEKFKKTKRVLQL